MPDRPGIERIAAATHAYRPDWPPGSIVALIERDPSLRAKTYQDLADAMTHIATDPATQTPARVREVGPWWRIGTPVSSDKSQLDPRRPRCQVDTHHHHEPADNCAVCRSDQLTTLTEGSSA